ncbi:hypothetical protein TB1_011606 [Malus domestica]
MQFSSCRQGALVLPFMLVQTRSVGVAFYARVDQELRAMQFRLVRTRSIWFVQFRLVRTRSIWCRVAVLTHAGKERWRSLLCSCRPGALCHAV